jgi:hypothetical protein
MASTVETSDTASSTIPARRRDRGAPEREPGAGPRARTAAGRMEVTAGSSSFRRGVAYLIARPPKHDGRLATPAKAQSRSQRRDPRRLREPRSRKIGVDVRGCPRCAGGALSRILGPWTTQPRR